MAIVKPVFRENPFVQIDRSCFEDPNLSWRAKGLLGYLLSRPPGWTIRKADLVKRSADGKTVVEGALLDLMEQGYIYYYPERDDKGKITEWTYEIYERPEYNPHLEEGKAKAQELKGNSKARNKRKNEKRLGITPETDNPKVDPETDNPKLDNPKLDNPLFSNNDLNNNDFIKHNLYESNYDPNFQFTFYNWLEPDQN